MLSTPIRDLSAPDTAASSAPQTHSPHPIDERVSKAASQALHSRFGIDVPAPLLHGVLTSISPRESRCISFKQERCPSLTLLLTRSSDTLTNITFKHPAKPGQDKPDKLAEGGVKKIYLGTSFDVSNEGNLFAEPQLKALGVLLSPDFLPLPLELLSRIPPSPHLLARPEQVVEYPRRTPSKYSKIYMSMRLLTEPDLFNRTETSTLTPNQKWANFVQSIANAAKGACSLGPTLVHRDLATWNITREGLFDYDGLCQEGYQIYFGPPLAMQPPQILLGLLHQAWKKHIEPDQTNILQQLCRWIPSTSDLTADEVWLDPNVIAFLGTYPPEKPPFHYNEAKDELFIHYTKKYDVFILGYQFVNHFKSISRLPTSDATKLFIEKMISSYEPERPAIEEVASFFEAYHSSIVARSPKDQVSDILAQAETWCAKGDAAEEHVQILGAELQAIQIKGSSFLDGFIPLLLEKTLSLDEARLRLQSALTNFEIFPRERP